MIPSNLTKFELILWTNDPFNRLQKSNSPYTLPHIDDFFQSPMIPEDGL
jgi:hypothetical protein